MKVLITGAGTAGPAAAIALHKAGIKAELFEARPAGTADAGAFVTITANGQDALAAIDTLPALPDTSSPTRRLRIFTPGPTAASGGSPGSPPQNSPHPGPTHPGLLREHIATAFDTDATPAAQIIRATQGPVTLTTACDIPALPAWHNEQMALTGDAAHAVSPATTQGASLAAEDAITLARCLRDIPGIPDALATYEQLRRDRAEHIVQTGTDTGANPAPPAPDTPKQGPPTWIFDHHIDWDAPVYAPTTH